jgi:hypothetical protein
MHRPRPNWLAESAALGDQLADWLLRHCPFSTLALLTLVVLGSALQIAQPMVLVIVAVIGDVSLSLVRRVRRARRPADPKHLAPRAPA